MALTVATNTGALMAQAAASSVNKDMETSMERLSTGKRVNSAADDAAGVAIASRLNSEIRGTNQAIRNAMDGQAMIDTAEGAHIKSKISCSACVNWLFRLQMTATVTLIVQLCSQKLLRWLQKLTVSQMYLHGRVKALLMLHGLSNSMLAHMAADIMRFRPLLQL